MTQTYILKDLFIHGIFSKSIKVYIPVGHGNFWKIIKTQVIGLDS